MKQEKCYVVSEYGGIWEDSWEIVKAVFLDKTLAEKYVSDHENLPESSLKISLEQYNLLAEELIGESEMTEAERTLPISELIHKLHPDLDLSELKRTEEYDRRLTWDYTGMQITETILICQ